MRQFSSATAHKAQEHGQHVYAYANVRTNQVLYSLTKSLNSFQSLKQLPDSGANNNPPKIRKDLWKPFFTLSLPATPDGRAQGLDAFQKLREWRKLHELYWTPPPELSKPYSEEQMKKLQKRLDDRGGSKKESVYDLIKRAKKKARQHIVMDQKANSVADLAAVLLEQSKLSEERQKLHQESQAAGNPKDVNKILELAVDATHGGLQKLEVKCAVLERSLRVDTTVRERIKIQEAISRHRRQKALMQFAIGVVARLQQETSQESTLDVEAGNRMAVELDQIEEQVAAIPGNDTSDALLSSIREARAILAKHAQEQETLTEDTSVEESRQQDPATEQKQAHRDAFQPNGIRELRAKIVDLEALQFSPVAVTPTSESQENDDQVGKTEMQPQVDVEAKLEGYLRVLDCYDRTYAGVVSARYPKTGSLIKSSGEGQTFEEAVALSAEARNISQKNAVPDLPDADFKQLQRERLLARFLRNKDLTRGLRRLNPALIDMDGVRVTWQNMLDAEFAEEWPGDVSHEPMGATRYTAPPPDAKPVFDPSMKPEKEWQRAREDEVQSQEEEVRPEREEVEIVTEGREPIAQPTNLTLKEQREWEEALEKWDEPASQYRLERMQRTGFKGSTNGAYVRWLRKGAERRLLHRTTPEQERKKATYERERPEVIAQREALEKDPEVRAARDPYERKGAEARALHRMKSEVVAKRQAFEKRKTQKSGLF